MAEQAIKYDLDGFDIVTLALLELLNQYPGLTDEITFSSMDENYGKTMVPVSGSVVETEREGITGHVAQKCLYPFNIIYRDKDVSESRKIRIKEWLDNLGRWLERQEVTINGTVYKLSSYPKLTGDRKILSITRQTPAYLDNVKEDATEDWIISLSARYQNEFDK